jgi:hypothetical protein
MEHRATSVGTRGQKGKFSSNSLKNGWTNLTYSSLRSTFRDRAFGVRRVLASLLTLELPPALVQKSEIVGHFDLIGFE